MKKHFFLFCVAVLLSITANSGILKAQTPGEPYVIMVEFTFYEEKADEAVELLAQIQSETLEKEEGCLIYDVLLSEEDPAKVFIYESYENEAAFKVHSKAPYFEEIVVKKLTPLIKHQKITKVIPLNNGEELTDEEV